nr:hypothetical protein [Actinomycetales bacterium]
MEAQIGTAVTSQIVAELSDAGAALRGMDVECGAESTVLLDITCDTRSPKHQLQVVEGLEQTPGVRVLKVLAATSPSRACSVAARRGGTGDQRPDLPGGGSGHVVLRS